MSNLSFDDIAIKLHEFAVEEGLWKSTEDATQEQVDYFMASRLMMIVSSAAEVTKELPGADPEEIATHMSHILVRTLELYGGLVEHGYTQVSLDYLIDKITKGVR